MASAWIEHVKKVASEKGITYTEALKVAKESYKKPEKEMDEKDKMEKKMPKEKKEKVEKMLKEKKMPKEKKLAKAVVDKKMYEKKK